VLRSRREVLAAAGKLALGSVSPALGACARRPQRPTIHLDLTQVHQTIEGFGTCLYREVAREPWFQSLYLDDLRASMLRIDLTPRFRSPYADFAYNSPWFHGHPPLPGPEGNNVRAYASPDDYQRPFAGRRAPIAVMGPDIDGNVRLLDLDDGYLAAAGALAKLGWARRGELGGFKIVGSLWSPAPWLKVPSGNRIGAAGEPLPKAGAPWPFIWNGNFAGGVLDVSGEPRPAFHDGVGPTSALTQFARGTAATLRGFMRRYGVEVHALGIQNEPAFEQFFGSCAYPHAEGWLKAVAAVRAEIDRHPDLQRIRIIGPEDVLGDSSYGMWQVGGGARSSDRNLKFLAALAQSPRGAALVDRFAVHGYGPSGAAAVTSDLKAWRWWAEGWTQAPDRGLPAAVDGFRHYGRESWMTETSGEEPAWRAPDHGFPDAGAFGLVVGLHNALTIGYESAWLYWQLADGAPVGRSTLTDAVQQGRAAKYLAVKHYFRFIRPGARRVEVVAEPASAIRASAYLHEADGKVVIVALNLSDAPLDVPVTWNDRGGAGARRDRWQVYTSSEGRLWEASAATVAPAGTLACRLPAYGVATLVSA
jgi:O-glycosyl hydrolase